MALGSFAFVSAKKFELLSKAFKEGNSLPKIHSWKEGNRAPHLLWENSPHNTKTFALIVDDPDAPGQEPWVHWIVFDIPASQKELEHSMARSSVASNGIGQGINDFKHVGYDGPYPPFGKKHHYNFKLYALDRELKLKAQATKKSLWQL